MSNLLITSSKKINFFEKSMYHIVQIRNEVFRRILIRSPLIIPDPMNLNKLTVEPFGRKAGNLYEALIN